MTEEQDENVLCLLPQLIEQDLCTWVGFIMNNFYFKTCSYEYKPDDIMFYSLSKVKRQLKESMKISITEKDLKLHEILYGTTYLSYKSLLTKQGGVRPRSAKQPVLASSNP